MQRLLRRRLASPEEPTADTDSDAINLLLQEFFDDTHTESLDKDLVTKRLALRLTQELKRDIARSLAQVGDGTTFSSTSAAMFPGTAGSGTDHHARALQNSDLDLDTSLATSAPLAYLTEDDVAGLSADNRFNNGEVNLPICQTATGIPDPAGSPEGQGVDSERREFLLAAERNAAIQCPLSRCTIASATLLTPQQVAARGDGIAGELMCSTGNQPNSECILGRLVCPVGLADGSVWSCPSDVDTPTRYTIRYYASEQRYGLSYNAATTDAAITSSCSSFLLSELQSTRMARRRSRRRALAGES